ncbi:MAG: amidohydrolase [Sphingobacteriaceae bacterium]|nr:amidohydrolase [Sphingobacteriaceae bacterium]
MSKNKIKELAKSLFPKILEIRRHIHAHPELSFQEFKTSEFIQKHLTEAGIPFTTGHVKTGIIAIIKGKNPDKKTILLRGDMDALPIQEKNKVSYCSTIDGVMHACGHDVHSSCVLGAAIILNQLKDEFEGTIKIVFQPGEEVLPGGAKLMIEEGLLENPKVDKAIALHVYPSMEAGKVGFRKGMYMASTDELYITVNGKGGHAAMVNEYVNPLLIASELLLEINIAFMHAHSLKGTPGENIPTVVAFGKIEGQGATNIIPNEVKIAGTMRTMNEEWRNEIHNRLKKIVQDKSELYGITSEIKIEKGYPFLVNDENFTEDCMTNAIDYLGKNNVEELPLRMTAEDFAFITQKVSSCFFRLGTGNQKKGINSGVHTATFDIDESALECGTGLLANLAFQEMNK